MPMKNYGMNTVCDPFDPKYAIEDLHGKKHKLDDFFHNVAPSMKDDDVIEIVENNLKNNKNIGIKARYRYKWGGRRENNLGSCPE